MFKVEVIVKQNEIIGEIQVDSLFFDKSQYDYAFYLFNNDERVDLSWYSESMEVKFDISNFAGELHIKSYIRDKRDDSKRVYDSKKITV